MPKDTLLCDENKLFLNEKIAKTVDKVLDRYPGVRAFISAHLLDEAFRSAQKSIKDFNLDAPDTSPYKEASHFCYWIVRLRPIRFDSQNLAKKNVSALLYFTDSKVRGNKTFFDGKDAKEYYINEYVAYTLCKDLILSIQNQYIEESRHTEVHKESLRKMATMNHMRVSDIEKSMIPIIRWFNGSPSDFAAMFEMMFNINNYDEEEVKENAS